MNNTNQTPTPETDAQYKEYARRDNNVKCVDIDFARKLERERDEARRELHEFRTTYELWPDHRDKVKNLTKERDQLKAELEDVRKLPHALELSSMDWQITELQSKLTATEAVCERLAHCIKVGNNHGYGLRIGDEALADYAKMKENK